MDRTYKLFSDKSQQFKEKNDVIIDIKKFDYFEQNIGLPNTIIKRNEVVNTIEKQPIQRQILICQESDIYIIDTLNLLFQFSEWTYGSIHLTQKQINKLINILIMMLNETIKNPSTIYFVSKKFRNNDLWMFFIKKFCEKIIFERHQYVLYEAIGNDTNDKECDDRLIVRLALMLHHRHEKKINIITNDRLKSIAKHWKLPSVYFEHKKNNKISNKKKIDASRFLISVANDPTRIHFYKFIFESKKGNQKKEYPNCILKLI